MPMRLLEGETIFPGASPGLALDQAVTEARSYILGAISAGADVYTGHGHGPLNHGYAPMVQRVLGR